MYKAVTRVGRGYNVSYPEFKGDGTAVINDFYVSFGSAVTEYFETLSKKDRRVLCRCAFSVEDNGETFAVAVLLAVRKCGRRCAEKSIVHQWRRWKGRDTVMTKK